jgi:hypothetical protein
LALGIGWSVSDRPVIALLAALAVFAFGATLMDSAVVPLLCTLPALVSFRIAIGGTDLTVSDAALAIAFIPALLFTVRPFSPPMRAMVWFATLYQLSILFTVVANPYQANLIEWFHSGLLTAGALIVGWSIGREGHARLGLTLLLLGATFLGAATTIQGLMQYADGDFTPIYPTWPYDIHKNAVGCILGIAAAMAFTRPSWTRWPGLFAQACFWICVTGILVAQSRQALTALAVALVVIVLRTQGASHERRSKIILLVVGPALALVITLVKSQIETGNEFNSFFQRVDWFRESIRIWQSDPLFGVGLRWWYTDRFPVRFQPPNVILESLTTGGLIGLVGFAVFMGGSLVVLWRLDPKYGALALAVVLSRLVQGQLDLFWVAVQTSIPFLIAGICLGAHAREHAEGSPPQESQPAELPTRVEV